MAQREDSKAKKGCMLAFVGFWLVALAVLAALGGVSLGMVASTVGLIFAGVVVVVIVESIGDRNR